MLTQDELKTLETAIDYYKENVADWMEAVELDNALFVISAKLVEKSE